MNGMVKRVFEIVEYKDGCDIAALLSEAGRLAEGMQYVSGSLDDGMGEVKWTTETRT